MATIVSKAAAQSEISGKCGNGERSERAPDEVRADGAEQADTGDVERDPPRLQVAVVQKRRCDERRDRTGDNARYLVHDGDAAIPHSCIEQFAEERGLGTIDEGVD